MLIAVPGGHHVDVAVADVGPDRGVSARGDPDLADRAAVGYDQHAARTSGEGIEFSGVREYVPGDRQRSINWAASTRRGRLQVNTFAAERSQDVVLLVDSTSDVGEPGSSALDLALRGAGAAARAYTEARDRVGVITYQWGGASWLAPALGRRQVYRIIDSMRRCPRCTGAGPASR